MYEGSGPFCNTTDINLKTRGAPEGPAAEQGVRPGGLFEVEAAAPMKGRDTFRPLSSPLSAAVCH